MQDAVAEAVQMRVEEDQVDGPEGGRQVVQGDTIHLNVYDYDYFKFTVVRIYIFCL